MSQRTICGRSLFAAWQQVDDWVAENWETNTSVARKIREKLYKKPCAVWLTDTDSVRRVKGIVKDAAANEQLYQFVLYNIPNRDCGGFSAGGSNSKASYLSWVKSVARALGLSTGIVIVEPDALAFATQFDEHGRAARLNLLREATGILAKYCPNAHVYLDAGHPEWLSANTTAMYLKQAGVYAITGYSINVSNAYDTNSCYAHGEHIQQLLGDRMRFVIDVSRNGAGTAKDNPHPWLNNPKWRLGHTPTTRVPQPNPYKACLDALLWIKVPGESDGAHDGAPTAGTFWPKGALRLLGADEECVE